MNSSFWHMLSRPIRALSPMDGVTDPPFRAVIDTIGHPSILYTEFISADGLIRHAPPVRRTLTFHTTQTPIIVQLFSANPDAVSEAVKLLGAYPVAGVDINMGCPNKHVVQKSGGASLIKKPKLAQTIIAAAQKAAGTLDRPFPVSVKTRIGYDKPDTEAWITTLLETNPAAIALHGRTVAQQYTGHADWAEIQKAAILAKQAGIPLLGNGDIQSHDDATQKIQKYTPDGVLIGRGACGNPWIFTGASTTVAMRLEAALLHVHYFHTLTPDANPLALRKHLAWYMKGLPNAGTLRMQIMTITSDTDAKQLVETWKTTLLTAS